MATDLFSHLFLLFLLFLSHSSYSTQIEVDDDDTDVLLSFKNISDPTNALSSWTPSTSPCSSTWFGVTCSSSSSHVTRLVLENLSLSGHSGLSLLFSLRHLRVLSLNYNNLSGPIPSYPSSSNNLKLLFLSSNRFSGPIPSSLLFSSPRLTRLDLSHNNLSGPLPSPSIMPSRLITLRLNSNNLSGPIPSAFLSRLPLIQDLNLSSNPLLCGPPLPTTCSATPAAAATVSPADDTANNPRRGLSSCAIVSIVTADVAILILVSTLIFCYFWRKFAAVASTSHAMQHHQHQGDKFVYTEQPPLVPPSVVVGGFERGKMVFMDDGESRFELEHLLKASAEMLGKGGHGTAYRAVLEDGSAVAVKRLREIQIGKREFQSQMELLGRLRHPNLVPLKAYYYARDEKLLVYDYMPGGSLFSLLHGNRGPGRTPLDWISRTHIAAGAARGLAFIHHASNRKLAHGNVKSTNILIDKDGNPRLTDFGLALIVPSPHSLTNGYRAPEFPMDRRRAWTSQRADVYALGIVLLEILTGKSAFEGDVNLPRWVQSVVREEWTAEVFDLELMRYKGIEEEMVAMLQIAMACVATPPDQRPKVGHVVRMIEEIRGGEDVSPSYESFGSVSDSPSASDDATTKRNAK